MLKSCFASYDGTAGTSPAAAVCVWPLPFYIVIIIIIIVENIKLYDKFSRYFIIWTFRVIRQYNMDWDGDGGCTTATWRGGEHDQSVAQLRGNGEPVGRPRDKMAAFLKLLNNKII